MLDVEDSYPQFEKLFELHKRPVKEAGTCMVYHQDNNPPHYRNVYEFQLGSYRARVCARHKSQLIQALRKVN